MLPDEPYRGLASFTSPGASEGKIDRCQLHRRLPWRKAVSEVCLVDRFCVDRRIHQIFGQTPDEG